jgi:hypothetical protein
MFNLFFEDSFYSYVNSIYDKIEDFFSKNQNQNFFNRTKDDVCNELVNRYSISFLEVDEKIKLISKDKFYFTTDILGREIKKPIYTFGVKFSGDKTLFRIKPSRYNHHVFEAYFSNYLNNELLCFDIEYHDDSSLKEVFNRNKAYLFFMVDNVNKDIEDNNLKIKQKIFTLYESYESDFHIENDLLEELGVERHDQKQNSKELFIPFKDKIKYSNNDLNGYNNEDLILGNTNYKRILDEIYSFCSGFEKYPKTYHNLDEEELRNILVTHLNELCVESVTAETFNKNGKTDILISHDSDILFIAECKIWHGQKKYLEAINQLLGYLRWNDTKSALIIFVKGKNFSNVLNKIDKVTRTHPNYFSSKSKTQKNFFNFIISAENNNDIHIELAVLLFYIPS